MTFIVPLEPITVTEADTATFECEISKPCKDIKWLKDGKTTLKHGKKYDIKSTDMKHSLKVHKSVVEDAGKYTIVTGNVKSTAKLTVKGENVNFFRL